MEHARMPPRSFLPARCHKNTQNTGTFLLVGRYGSLHQMVGTTLPQVPGMENLPPIHSMAYPLRPLAKQPWNIRQR